MIFSYINQSCDRNKCIFHEKCQTKGLKQLCKVNRFRHLIQFYFVSFIISRVAHANPRCHGMELLGKYNTKEYYIYIIAIFGKMSWLFLSLFLLYILLYIFIYTYIYIFNYNYYIFNSFKIFTWINLKIERKKNLWCFIRNFDNLAEKKVTFYKIYHVKNTDFILNN